MSPIQGRAAPTPDYTRLKILSRDCLRRLEYIRRVFRRLRRPPPPCSLGGLLPAPAIIAAFTTAREMRAATCFAVNGIIHLSSGISVSLHHSTKASSAE